nr:probable trehalose-phosphate phosphatase F [Tanacetum cinerariifolium]
SYSFDHIINRAKDKKIVILDYDGTLSPIVDNPDRAFMFADMYSVVKGVAAYFPTAIISGRSHDKVRELVGLEELYYTGSHRLDTMFRVQETSTNDCSSYIRSTKLGYYSLKRKQMQMVGGNGGNQFRQYAGQNAGNLAGYNKVIGNQVIQNAVQNPRVQNVGNQNDISKAKACMLAKAQASDASSKAKVQECGSKAKLQTSRMVCVLVNEVRILGTYSAKEYLSWNYFPRTDKENTDNDITDKDITDEDCIHESNYAMSKGIKIYGDLCNGDYLAFATKNFQASICILHLQLAFASKHLQLAFASKHLQLAFVMI